MANRQLFIVSAIALILGIVVGMSSASGSQTAFSGANPTAAKQYQGIFNPGIVRIRSENDYIVPGKVDLVRAATYRGTMRAAAPQQYRVRGVPAIERISFERCEGLSRTRLSRCIQAVLNGEDYSLNYFTPSYR